MLKRVGFGGAIELDWLNMIVGAYLDDNDDIMVRELLEGHLRDLMGEESVKKTISILSRTWINVDPNHEPIRDRGLELFNRSDDNEKIALHWSMMMLAYPIFYDVSATIGKLLELQDDFTFGMVKRRIYGIWGERRTVYNAIKNILQSMKDWGILEKVDKQGGYRSGKKLYIQDKDVKLFLLQSHLIAGNKAHLQSIEINSLDELFPFSMDIGLEDLYESEIFSLNRMGGTTVVGLWL